MRILIAEDNAVNRLFAEKLLLKLGHDVLSAEDGLQALEVLAKESVDLVLMDIQMPNMDGLEALKRIRQGFCEATNAQVPVVAVTAHAMEGDRERFISEGMDGFIAKPLEVDDLAALIKVYDTV